MSDDHSVVIEYRLSKLEEAVLKLSLLSDVVTRWDERFSAQGALLQCNLHAARMVDIEKKLGEVSQIIVDRTKAILLVDEHEVKIKDMQQELKDNNAFVNRAIGALVILSILAQVFGPMVREYVQHAVHPTSITTPK